MNLPTRYHLRALAALALTLPCLEAAAVTVDFAVASDLTSSFRELRANTNDSHQTGAGSDGLTAGFFRLTAATDGGALRYVYDADGTGTGTSIFTSGSVSMDVRWNNANINMGLYFGSNTSNVAYRFRPDNSGTTDNSVASFDVNQTNNFSFGTALTTISAPTAVVSSSGFALNAGSTNVFPTTTLTTGSWYRMKMDFSVNGLNQRTLQFRIWDNILETGLPKFDQTISLTAANYTGAGEVGFWTVAGTGGQTVDIDNFTVVPEPSTYAAIAALAGLAVAVVRRRR